MSSLLDKAHSLNAEETIPTPELIGGLFPKGFISVVASKPGTGKTWLMLIKSHAIEGDGGHVVIFNGESGIQILQQRTQLLKYTFTSAVKVFNETDFLDCGGLAITDPKGWENITQIVREAQADCVFFDSLVAFCACDESDMNTMRGVFARLAKLAQAYDCAVVLNHHLRKGATGKVALAGLTTDDVIGSSIISRIACNVYILQNEDDLISCTCVKSWYKKVGRFTLQLVEDDGYVLVKSSRPLELYSNKEHITKTLRFDVHWRSAKYVAKLCGMSLRTAQRVLTQLTEEGTFNRRKLTAAETGGVMYEYRHSMIHDPEPEPSEEDATEALQPIG